MAKILIVDDQPANLSLLSDALEAEGYHILVARSGKAALQTVQRNRPDVILLDVMMPEMDGFETCGQLKADESTRDIPVIFVTAKDEARSILEGFRIGGVDYLTKPIQTEELLVRVKTHLKIRMQARELRSKNEQLAEKNAILSEKNRELENEIHQRRKAELALEEADERLSILSQREAERWGLQGFIGKSQEIGRVIRDIRKLQPFDTTNVLISGESGSGKELVARAIHFGGPRSKGPFIPVNCSAVPRDLAESYFFGHVRGAFTGAQSDHKGFFEQAARGTLFLDEIGEMPPDLQVKLLRVLEDETLVPVGGTQARKIDVRILSATNIDLQSEDGSGGFRQDLFFRLAGFTLSVPPLRDRPEDIPLIADHFLNLLAGEMGMAKPSIAPETLAELKRYGFPGNVRELKNLIERALIESGGGEIRPEHLHFAIAPCRLEVAKQAGGAVPAASSAGHPFSPRSDEAKILAFVKEHTTINNTECRELLSVGIRRACYLLRKLYHAGWLDRENTRRSAQYRLGRQAE